MILEPEFPYNAANDRFWKSRILTGTGTETKIDCWKLKLKLKLLSVVLFVLMLTSLKLTRHVYTNKAIEDSRLCLQWHQYLEAVNLVPNSTTRTAPTRQSPSCRRPARTQRTLSETRVSDKVWSGPLSGIWTLAIFFWWPQPTSRTRLHPPSECV